MASSGAGSEFRLPPALRTSRLFAELCVNGKVREGFAKGAKKSLLRTQAALLPNGATRCLLRKHRSSTKGRKGSEEKSRRLPPLWNVAYFEFLRPCFRRMREIVSPLAFPASCERQADAIISVCPSSSVPTVGA